MKNHESSESSNDPSISQNHFCARWASEPSIGYNRVTILLGAKYKGRPNKLGKRAETGNSGEVKFWPKFSIKMQ